MISQIIVAALAARSIAPAFSQQLPVTVRSPDTRISVRIAQNDAGQLMYSIERNGETVFARIGAARAARRRRCLQRRRAPVWPRSVDQVHKLVATKAAEARDRFNEITHRRDAALARAARAMQWIFRAYDDGVAFRYVVPADAGLDHAERGSRKTPSSRFGADYDCHGLQRRARGFEPRGRVRSRSRRAASASTTTTTCRWCAARPSNAFAIGEADLRDYGGMYLDGRGDGKPGVQARVSRRLDDQLADRARRRSARTARARRGA